MNPSFSDATKPQESAETSGRLSPTILFASSRATRGASSINVNKGRLPPKKRKIPVKYGSLYVPTTILKRQVASYWKESPLTKALPQQQTTVVVVSPRTTPPDSGNPFYLERYGENVLAEYPEGPQKVDWTQKGQPKPVQPSEDPAKFIYRRATTTPVDLTKVFVDNQNISKNRHTNGWFRPQTQVLRHETRGGDRKLSPNLSPRQGAVTPSPYPPNNLMAQTGKNTTAMTQESLPLQLSPLRRPQKNRFRYIPTLRTTAQGTSASNPIVIDEGEHRASMGTQDALQNNKNHPRQTIRAATTTHMAVPITTTATGHRPGPDSSTTRPAVYPARIAHTAGGLSIHTSTSTNNQTEQALLGHPSSRIVRHPLNDTSHSGRRTAAFSPRK